MINRKTTLTSIGSGLNYFAPESLGSPINAKKPMPYRSEKLSKIHNDGQADGAEGNYNPPHSSVIYDALPILLSDEQSEEIAAYKAGYENGKDD